MHYHCNATTNQKQRTRLKNSQKTYRTLAQELEVSLATIARWKKRELPHDRSCRRRHIAYAFDAQESALILSLRQKGLTLDDLTAAVQAVLPQAKRPTIHRLLVRHGVSRLTRKEPPGSGQDGQTQDERHGQFKDYPPGFLHIDCFYLPKLAGQKRYCFVAIDRATRLSVLRIYEHKDKAAATDFLEKCLSFFPFRVSKILTDNGREFPPIKPYAVRVQEPLWDALQDGPPVRCGVRVAGDRAPSDASVHGPRPMGWWSG